MLACGDIADPVRQLHTHLSGFACGRKNGEVLACILASWACGEGALPAWIGLSPQAFRQMLDDHFAGAGFALPASLQPLAEARCAEFNELRELMLAHRAGECRSEAWMADIVAAACMGSDHLWQDLGLWNRRELSALLQANFPSLAARNTGDMKWKKFLYKQLCESAGIYVCRSPSCEVCQDYAKCFGPED